MCLATRGQCRTVTQQEMRANVQGQLFLTLGTGGVRHVMGFLERSRKLEMVLQRTRTPQTRRLGKLSGLVLRVPWPVFLLVAPRTGASPGSEFSELSICQEHLLFPRPLPDSALTLQISANASRPPQCV